MSKYDIERNIFVRLVYEKIKETALITEKLEKKDFLTFCTNLLEVNEKRHLCFKFILCMYCQKKIYLTGPCQRVEK